MGSIPTGGSNRSPVVELPGIFCVLVLKAASRRPISGWPASDRRPAEQQCSIRHSCSVSRLFGSNISGTGAKSNKTGARKAEFQLRSCKISTMSSTVWYTSGYNNLIVHNKSGCRHNAVPHDGPIIGSVFGHSLNASLAECLLNVF